MKRILIIVFLMLGLGFCSAQTPVLPRYGTHNFGDLNGAYYKDLEGFHDQYVGTWLYNNGSTSLKIIFAQKTMFHHFSTFGDYYGDIVVGEYQYIENGVQKVNTLSTLELPHTSIFDYNLYSVSQRKKDRNIPCLECATDEKRLVMSLNEPLRRNIKRGISNDFVMRAYTENGIQKLKIWFFYTGNGLEVLDTPDEPFTPVQTFSLPYGEYVLIKQP